ncbi:MAG: peroxidase-like protein [Planctomycetota bacterium]|nr:MAG: peroxidase-like protein [Planctomycetota bacterium]
MANMEPDDDEFGMIEPLISHLEVEHHLIEFGQALMRGPSSLTVTERELIATYVSAANQCPSCAKSHEAAARQLLRDEWELVSEILEDVQTARISERLSQVVTNEDVLRARQAGADDSAIHDTILIASMFCMFNRYVEGLAAWTPKEAVLSAQLAERLATRDRGSRLRGFA